MNRHLLAAGAGDTPTPVPAASQLPWEVDQLLRIVVRRRFTLYYFGADRTQPDAIAAVKTNADTVDGVILHDHRRAAAYRAPLLPDEDPLAPEYVLWHYLSCPVWTLRAVLSVSLPGGLLPHYPTPPECRIPEAECRPYTIRPPSFPR